MLFTKTEIRISQKKPKSSKVHSLNSGKVSVQIQLNALPELSEWTLINDKKRLLTHVRISVRYLSLKDDQFGLSVRS